MTVIIIQNYRGLGVSVINACGSFPGERMLTFKRMLTFASCRAQWEALDDRERERYPYEMELWEWLEKLMADLRYFS